MDGTEERKDTSSGQSGQSSSETKGTSKSKGKVFTDAEITKIKSDTAAEAGRLRKAAEKERDTLKGDLQSTVSRLDSLERERDESRLAEAEAGGNPDELRSYRREQAVTKRDRQVSDRERDLVRREEQLKSDRLAIDADKRVISIAYIAAKHGLETEELESLDISDPDTLEKVAEKLAAARPKTGEGEEETPGGETEEAFVPDSGETIGGVGTLNALAKANEDFSAGKITEKQLQEIASKVK